MLPLTSALISSLGYEPTPAQERVAHSLADFFLQEESRVFVLNGYAGTGKTTLIASLLKVMKQAGRNVLLLAPTGRAAKVLSSYSGSSASTIHKRIYTIDEESGRFVLRESAHRDTLFIVDEASMVSGEDNAGQHLLDDLFNHVFSGTNSRLILCGDLAQLPPVGLSVSPALHPKYLRERYFMPVLTGVLDHVVRQQEESGILQNATVIRNMIRNREEGLPVFQLEGFSDVRRIDGTELQEYLEEAYGTYGPEGTMFICRSNKRAYLFNQQIRARIRWQEDLVSAGDRLMCVRNNYYWLKGQKGASFIANGDMLQVDRIGSEETLWNANFLNASVTLTDHPGEPKIDLTLLTDTITSDGPGQSQEQRNSLYQLALESYADLGKGAHFALKKDPFYNALHVKYAYAVTCHKAQGGQWPAVFVDAGYLTKETTGIEFLRWLYTAFTRSTQKLYLVNFPDAFFEESIS